MSHSGASAATNAPNSFVRTKLIDAFPFTKADIGKIAAKVPIVPRCVNSCTMRRKSVGRHFHLGHSTNTVAANYGSGYALEVMREHMVRVWK